MEAPHCIDIAALVERAPLARLTDGCNGRLVVKVRERFSETQQQLFFASFYCYMNYIEDTEFVVDLDNVWKWLGFSQKVRAKQLLESNFVLDVDYKCLLSLAGEQKSAGRGGHNKQTVLMTVRTFKRLCLKAGTSKADEVHEYYLNMERMLQDVVAEECADLSAQMKRKDAEMRAATEKLAVATDKLERFSTKAEREKQLLREKTLLEQFPDNVQCVYYGTVLDRGEADETLVKFGCSNKLRVRTKAHHHAFAQFALAGAFRVENKLMVENALKAHPVLEARRRTAVVRGALQTELWCVDGLSFDELDKIIHDVAQKCDCTGENYARIIDENTRLAREISERNDKITLIEQENLRIKAELSILARKAAVARGLTTPVDAPVLPDNAPAEVVTRAIVQSFRRVHRQKDGLYHIGGKTYTKLIGPREEVWNGIAYKPPGELTKASFCINKIGKLVSVSKSVESTQNNRITMWGGFVPGRDNKEEWYETHVKPAEEARLKASQAT
jgi:predicted nuclease with TOPRIM domain